MREKLYRRMIVIVTAVMVFSVGHVSAGTFVLDQASLSLGTIPANTEDLLNDPTPVVGYDRSALGLLIGDRISSVSSGRDPIDVLTYGPKDHLFSVSRDSIGVIGSAVWNERIADTVPGALPGHPSDLFYWVTGTVGNALAPAGLGWGGGTGTGDEANTNLVNAFVAGDNVDGYDRYRRSGPPGLPPFKPVYFTLRAGSPTLAAIGASSGDILAVGGPFGAVPVVFAQAAAIGIPPGFFVEIDALSLEVRKNLFGKLYLHMVEYSVSSATATGFALTGSGDIVDSGADIILFDGTNSLVGHRPAELGLRVDDDIDALASLIH